MVGHLRKSKEMLLFYFCRNKDVDFCLEVDQIREQLGPHVSAQIQPSPRE